MSQPQTRTTTPLRRALRVGAGVLTATALAGGLALAAAAPAAASPVTPVTSVAAGSFVHSVGVNIHSYYDDTSYADTSRMVRLLQELGVRHVRDGLVPNRPDEVAALNRLGQAGIRSTLIVGGTSTGATQQVDPAQLSALGQVAPYVDAVEPTNEYDCSGDPNWIAHQRAYSDALVASLQADARFRPFGVLGSSFCRPDSVAQYGSVTGQASVANAHDYAAGQAPELALESRLPQWSATQGAGLPRAVTETGYHNAVNAGAWSPGVTEATAADYTVRALLDAKRLGVARTYLYELLDEKSEPQLANPEQHYGLVRQDGTPKPAFTAVKNLLAAVAGGSTAGLPDGGPTSSDVVSVNGGGSLLRTLSIADATGGGETLALWLAAPLEDTTTHQRIDPAPRAVTVRLTGTHAGSVRQPSRDDTPVAVGTGSAFTLPVGGAVTLLHLAPVSPTTTATPCTAQPGYAALATGLGATVSSDLAGGWTGAPGPATGLPDGVTGGVTITGAGQQRRVAVPGSPTAWTVAVWQRTDAGAANFSTFLRAPGAAGALLRTYDLTGDAPSHMQLSGYGLPSSALGYGTETWGQATVGTWHLVALSVGGGAAAVSVDGIVQGRVSSGSGALSALDLGAVSDGFRGGLAGLSVYPRVLTADELGRLATTSPNACATTTTATTAATTAPTTKPTTATVTKTTSTVVTKVAPKTKATTTKATKAKKATQAKKIKKTKNAKKKRRP